MTAEAAPGPRRRFTADEAHQLVAAAIVDPDEPYEFVCGEFYYRPRHEAAHALAIAHLEESLRLPDSWVTTGRVPVACAPDSLPEPDVIIVRSSAWLNERRYPRGDECALVVEVAVSSQTYDRWKARLYAAAGVAEYWLLDLPARRLEVHRQPLIDEARYAEIRLLGAESMIEFPGLQQAVSVGELLP